MPDQYPHTLLSTHANQRFIRRVIIGFFLVLGIILAVQVGSYFLQRAQIKRETGTAILVSTAGNQRTLSQRIALLSLALLHVNSDSVRERAKSVLINEITALEQQQIALRKGDKERGIESDKSSAVHDIFFGSYELDAKVQSFISVAKHIALSDLSSLSPQNEQLLQLTEKSSELLRLFEKLIEQYTTEGVAGIKGLELLTLRVLLLGIAAAISIALFIFIPLVRRLQNEFSERSRIQSELREQNSELEQFAAVVAHDLKAPLNNIGGFSQFLRSKLVNKDDREAIELLEYIDQSTKRMGQMITELLQYARLTGRSRRFQKIKLNPLILKVLQDFEIQIKETKAEVKIDTLPAVLGDETQLKHLFHNLISNALKYKHAERTPSILFTSVSYRDDEVLVAVEDNGRGFPIGCEERMFEPFRRLTSDTDTEGSGFGLALCRKIAIRHKGSIKVEHVASGGTRFVIALLAADL